MPVIIDGQTYHTFEESKRIVGERIEQNAENLYQRLIARNKENS